MQRKELKFKLAGTTKGTVFYTELNSDGQEVKGDDAVVGRLYIRKAALDGAAGEKLKVIIEEDA